MMWATHLQRHCDIFCQLLLHGVKECLLNYLLIFSFSQEEKVQSHRLEKRKEQLMLAAKQELETVRGKLRKQAEEDRQQAM